MRYLECFNGAATSLLRNEAEAFLLVNVQKMLQWGRNITAAECGQGV